jgi:cell wall-associated NlpC family hydrolase
LSSGITTAVTDRMDILSRGGAVIAVSSGLVASMAIPASAMPRQGAPEPQTASMIIPQVAAMVGGSGAAVSRAGVAPASASLAKPVAKAAPVKAAPAKAATKAAPVKAAAAKAAAAPRSTPVRASRSAARAALPVAHKAAAARVKVARVPAKAVSTAGMARGAAAMSLASRYVGIYYRYGGTTPRGFDCSGMIQYIYRQLGVSLPRTATDQMRATKRISRSQARPGDLVFVVHGGHATHVGIYAGNGMMYDSPRKGKAVSKRKIWTSSPVYGRIV